jgi:8-oxo-dGTP pyrophosphatase MutT (NUDIX family)
MELKDFLNLTYGAARHFLNSLTDAPSFNLQKPELVLASNKASVFERAELLRLYFTHHLIEHRVAFVEYDDPETAFHRTEALVIAKMNGKYREVLNDREYDSWNLAFRKTYNGFVERVEAEQKVNPEYLYASLYEKPDAVYAGMRSFLDFVRRDKELIDSQSRCSETSAMAVVCCRKKGGITVLTIENENTKIDFPKGHVEAGESDLEAAIRECREETRVAISAADLLRELDSYSYSFNAGILRLDNLSFYRHFRAAHIDKTIKVFVFLIAEEQEPQPLHQEGIVACRWLELSALEAKLSFPDAKRIARVFPALLHL